MLLKFWLSSSQPIDHKNIFLYFHLLALYFYLSHLGPKIYGVSINPVLGFSVDRLSLPQIILNKFTLLFWCLLYYFMIQ